MQQAFDAAVSGGRHLEAAQLARALNLRGQAAQLYEKAGEFFEAAIAYRESGQASFALSAALRVQPADPCYSAAARLVIDLSAALRLMRHEHDTFLEPYLRCPPGSRDDIEAWFLRAQMYEVYHYTPQAIELYRRISAVEPRHAATARLKLAEAAALKQATTEIEASVADVRAVRELAQKNTIPVARKNLRPGSLIAERYTVVRLLGTGSTASVLQAHDTKLGEDVALKLLDAVQRDATQDARFRREVSLARRLSHPNIVRLFDLGEHQGRSFLTMELLDGSDLSHTPGAYDRAKLKGLFLQILDGLGYAHAHHIIHRDIKPENLFVTSAGIVKIADFGIAKTLGDTRITRTGSMGGTPYYMSPEQITDFATADYRTDLYALGVVMYELFAGRLPFEGAGLTQLLIHHLETAPEPMRSRKPELPQALDDLVLKLMQKAREDRFQSCREVSAALTAIPL